MVDAKNTEQARDAHRGNGQVPETEPHRIHLVEATGELLAAPESVLLDSGPAS